MSVPAGGDLQAALDAVPAGGTVLLQPGATYTGRFIIRRAVTLRTGGPLPESRITPESAGTLPILASPTNEPALSLAPGVRQVRIIGIEIAPNGHSSGTSIEIGSNLETDAARQPVDVVLDRLLVRGHPVHGQKRGLGLHGSHITVRRSHISDFKLQGQDTQAIWINNGWGPFVIEDNYLEASGENILTGGDTPRINQLVPTDLTITGNTIAKPLHWKSEGWTVKNLLELKSARRVIVRGNVLSGSWVSGQTGYAVLFTPRNQYGQAPWTVVEDVLVEHNIIRESSSGFNLLGDDDEQPSQRTQRITMRHNLLLLDHHVHGGEGRCMMVGRAPQMIEFSQNTCIATGPSPVYTYVGGDVRTIAGGVFRSNVFLHNTYGFGGDNATADARQAMALHYPDGVLTDNLIGGGSASRYPPGNHVLSVDEWQAQFVNFAAGDFRLTDESRARFATLDGGLLASTGPDPAAPPADEGAGTTAAPRTATLRTSVAPQGRRSPPAATPPPTPTGVASGENADPRSRVHQLAAAVLPVPSAEPVPTYAVPIGAAPTAGATSAHPRVTVIVLAPADALTPHSTVRVATNVADLSGPVSRVAFHVDGVLIGTRTAAPFEVPWPVPASGTFRITAIVTDASGAHETSVPLEVRVR